jgi:hypothetical protein
MRKKYLAVAAAMMLTSAAPTAFAATVETVAGSEYGPVTINKNTTLLSTLLFKVTEDIDYIFSGVVSKTANAGEGRYLTASLLDSVGQAVSGAVFTIHANPSSDVDKTFTSGLLHLAEGWYQIAFTYHGSGNAVYTGTSASLTHTVQAVPGPEAGAGLGALAMGGMAFWLQRRRKTATTAA